MLIDFRVRPPFKSFLKLDIFANASWRNHEQKGNRSRREWCASFEKPCMEAFMDEFEANGTTLGVVMGRRNIGGGTFGQGNVTPEDLYELMNAYPGKFVGMGGFDVAQPDLLKDVEHSVKELGMRGVCIEPTWSDKIYYADDPFLFDLYQCCDELNVPVCITMSFRQGPSIKYADPMQIEGVARKFPNLKIIIPHAGWPFFINSMAIQAAYPNVYMIPDVYLYPEFMPLREDYVRFSNVATPGQVLYASSYPVRSMGQALRLWRQMAWFADTLEKTLYGNAAKLLGLE